MEEKLHNLIAFFSTETGYVILFIAIITITFVLVRLFKLFFKRRVLDAVLASKDPTNYLFFQHIITATIYIAGFSTAFYMIPSLRTLSASLLAGAGIFAVAIGFASQKAFSNIISGLFIVIFKPFRINDRVAVGTTVAGVIEDITLRHTIVRSYENKRFVIPNSLISEEIIINSDITDSEICKFALFKIACLKHAPFKSAPSIFAFLKFAPVKFDFIKIAYFKFAFKRSTFDKSVNDNSACERFAPDILPNSFRLTKLNDFNGIYLSIIDMESVSMPVMHPI